MTTMAELILKADYSQMDRAKGSLDSLTEAGGKASSAMRSLAATLGVAFGIKEVLDAAQAYTTINNSLALVTDSTEQLAAAQKQIFDISQQTRQPLEATAEVYQRLAQNAGTLGMSLNDVSRITETIGKLMVISGGSAESANAALTQLGQAMASGALRGDELNSVMEQAPALAKAIADGMGVTIGQLRAMGAEGKITTQILIEALKNQANAVDSQFARLAPTLSQSMTTIKNSFTEIIGQLDEASGASKSLAGAIQDISKSMDKGGGGSSLMTVVKTWEVAFSNAKESAGDFRDELILVRDIGSGLAETIANAFIELPSNVSFVVRLVSAEISDFVAKSASGFQTLKDASKAAVSGDSIADAFARGEERYKRLEKQYQKTTDAAHGLRNEEIALGKLRAEQKSLEYLLGDTDQKVAGGKGGGKPTDDKEKKKREERLKNAHDLFTSEEELESEHYRKSLNELIWYSAQVGLTESKRNEAAERLTVGFYSKLDEIRKRQGEVELSDTTARIQRQMQADVDRQTERMAMLQEQFATEAELENLQYAAKLESYAAYAEAFRISEADQQSAREKMLLEHQARMDVARRNDANSDLKTLSGRLGATQKFMNDIYTATGSHNQRMFKLIQTAGAAQAAANAYIAASQALADPSVPFFAKFAAVAQVLATGFGLVNSLKGLGSSDSGGGGGVSGGSSVDTSGIAPQAQPTIRAQTVDFRIETRGIWRDDDVADLMQAIGERLGDGAKFGKVEFLTR